jgi:GINS complex subunit 2
MIEIEARFNHPPLKLIRGTFGPFYPNQRVQVPLWLALTLKKQKKCRLVLPEWLNGESLAEVLKEERAQEGTFQELPFHYVEIATLLLKTAGDEFSMPDRIRSLVEDIENVRMEKIRRGLQGMSDTVLRGRSVMSTKMNHVGAMEITTVRDFLTQAMNMFYVLSGQEVVGGQGGGGREGGGGRRLGAGGAAAVAAAAAMGGRGVNGPPRKLRRFRGDAPSEGTN